jgi:rod shape determining protein RodA
MFKHIDWLLFANIVLLIMMSLVAIASALSEPLEEAPSSFMGVIGQLDLQYVFLQLQWFGVGLFAMFIVLLPDYHAIGEYYKWIYVVVIALLVAVYFFGKNINGTTGWFRIGTSGFQPSEVGKVAMVIVLARMISERCKGKDGGIRRIRDLLPLLGVVLLPVGLIILQKDFGTAVVYLFTFFSMLFMARTSWKLIAGILGSVGVALPVTWLLLDQWQKNRVYTFLGVPIPGASAAENAKFTWQSDLAKQAAGSGQITGRGLFSIGGQNASANIPYNHTDFIFASTTEAVGFIGAMILILLFCLLLFRTLYLASKAKDDFGMLVIIGVFAMTLFHVFENIGMNIGVTPITGIPLPFFSYGGSNLLTNMIAFGLVINVSMRRVRWSF